MNSRQIELFDILPGEGNLIAADVEGRGSAKVRGLDLNVPLLPCYFEGEHVIAQPVAAHCGHVFDSIRQRLPSCGVQSASFEFRNELLPCEADGTIAALQE